MKNKNKIEHQQIEDKVEKVHNLDKYQMKNQMKKKKKMKKKVNIENY